MEKQRWRAAETESERESDCRWLVDRWASGQVRWVDSGKPRLTPTSPTPSPPQLETADVG